MRKTGRWGPRSLTLSVLVLMLALTPALLYAAPQNIISTDDVTAQSSPEELQDEIDSILDDPRLDGAQAGVQVRHAETGEVWYEHDADERLMPASNMKLLTGAAAFDALGPDYQFTTSVLTDGVQRGPVLHGDLYLRGGGDPTMLAEDYAMLAEDLADMGIKRIQGALVADDTFFDDVRLGQDWAWGDEPYYYAAQISGLTVSPNEDYDAGTVIVEVSPGDQPGDPVDVELVPDNDYVNIENNAVTTEAGEGDGVSIERPHGENTISVEGSLAVDSSGTRVWRSVWEPTGLAADVFRKALEDNGIQVHEETQFEATPDGAEELTHVDSMTLADMYIPFQKLSNNGHAEVLVKTMGQELRDDGSWNAGIDVATDYFESLGLDTSAFRMADGSGLSRFNLIAPQELTDLLIAIQDEEWFDILYNAIPIAGIDERMIGGTLRSRMQGTAAEDNVHAKTGTLTSASALSGYVTTADGEDLVFSILFNYHLSGAPTDLQDEIAITLAEYSEED